jgi:DNA-directed RNA polymerase specialized sigma24 family protein
MWDIWVALPPEYHQPRAEYTEDDLRAWPASFSPGRSLAAWLRTTLYHEALLRRAEGDYAGAQAALDRAATVQDYPDAGEFRLPFLEKLEAARLAIIRKNYSDAYQAVRQAGESVNAYPSQLTGLAPAVNRLPPKPMELAELSLLEGIARLGMNAKDPRGRELIETTLGVARTLAANLPPNQRQAFLSQFVAWAKLDRS